MLALRNTVAPKPSILVVAPFLGLEWEGNRPKVLGEVLSTVGAVEVLTTDWDHQTKKRRVQVGWPAVGRVHYLSVPAYNSNISIQRMWSHFVFGLRAGAWFFRKRNRFDVVYVTLPLNLAAALIVALAREKVCISDIVDVWPDVLPFPRWAVRSAQPIFALWRRLFVFTCRKSDILLAVSDRFLSVGQQYFRKTSGQSRRFYPCHVRLSVPKSDCATDTIDIAYVGNIGRLYDFETLLEVLGRPGNRGRYRLQIIGDGDRREWLIAECQARHIAHEYHGIVFDSSRLGLILSSCRLGFNGYRNTSAAFSYKATTYLAAGLALLNSMSGDLEALVVTEGIGVNYRFGDANSLSQALSSFVAVDQEIWMRQCDNFFAREIERDAAVGRIREFLSGAIDTVSRGSHNS